MIYFESSINVDLVLNVPSGYYPAPFHYVLRASTQIQIMWTGWHNFSSMQKNAHFEILWQNKLGTGGGGWGHLSPSKIEKFPKPCLQVSPNCASLHLNRISQKGFFTRNGPSQCRSSPFLTPFFKSQCSGSSPFPKLQHHGRRHPFSENVVFQVWIGPQERWGGCDKTTSLQVPIYICRIQYHRFVLYCRPLLTLLSSQRGI